MAEGEFRGYEMTDVDFTIANRDINDIYDGMKGNYGVRWLGKGIFEQVNLGGPHIYYFGYGGKTAVVSERLIPSHLVKSKKNIDEIEHKFLNFYKNLPLNIANKIDSVVRMKYRPEQWTNPPVQPLVMYGAEILGYDINLKNVLIIGVALTVAWFALKPVKSVTKIILFVILAFSIIHYGHQYIDSERGIGGATPL